MIELLVVLALIAVATAITTLALRDPARAQLDREAARLAALLEVARTEARASGVRASWRTATRDDLGAGASASAAPPDFVFTGLPPQLELPRRWLDPSVSAEVIGARALILGPEPILPAQRVALRLDNHRLVIASDGLGPFEVVAGNSEARP
jgi:general secretion pathway protein H